MKVLKDSHLNKYFEKSPPIRLYLPIRQKSREKEIKMKRMAKHVIIERKDAPRVKLKNQFYTDILISNSDGEDFQWDAIEISLVDYDCGDYACSAVDVYLKDDQNSRKQAENEDILSAIRHLENMAKLLRKKHGIKKGGD